MKKSIARRIAAQQNGRKSGGPATAAGRRRCAEINLKHGQCAAGTTLLPGESAERFHALRDSFIDYFRPAHPAELFYADQVASNAWRLLRSQCLETSSIKLASQPTPGQSRQDAAAVAWQASRPDLHLRYEAARQRAFRQNFQDLFELTLLRGEMPGQWNESDTVQNDETTEGPEPENPTPGCGDPI